MVESVSISRWVTKSKIDRTDSVFHPNTVGTSDKNVHTALMIWRYAFDDDTLSPEVDLEGGGIHEGHVARPAVVNPL